MKVWSAKPSHEEKAEVVARLPSGTTPTPTITEEVTSKVRVDVYMWLLVVACTCIRTSSCVYNIVTKFTDEQYTTINQSTAEGLCQLHIDL